MPLAMLRARLEMSAPAIARAKKLPIWKGEVAPELLSGGLSNINLTIEDGGEKYVVRIGSDEPHLGVYRANEYRAFRAAHAAGVAAEPIYNEPDLLVLRYIPGPLALTRRFTRPQNDRNGSLPYSPSSYGSAQNTLKISGSVFWPFHHNRWYVRQLIARGEALEEKWRALLPNLSAVNNELEEAIGKVRVVYSHNDLNTQNLVYDGKRLWFVDLEYCGFSMDLFDKGRSRHEQRIWPSGRPSHS